MHRLHRLALLLLRWLAELRHCLLGPPARPAAAPAEAPVLVELPLLVLAAPCLQLPEHQQGPPKSGLRAGWCLPLPVLQWKLQGSWL
jgi:hypothetical protein